MASLKTLAKDTAIYGASSIIGRFLNYLLVPLYTAQISAASGGYGVITNVYAYTALLMIILTYGMETTFFRYANKQEENPDKVYGTTLSSVGFTSLLFILLVMGFLPSIAGWMKYPDHPEYIATMGVCIAIDAFQCIPFAYLRYKKRPIKFAGIKLFNIFLNIGLNMAYFLLLPALGLNPGGIYGADGHTFNVAWVFYINLFCSASLFLFFIPELKGFRFGFDGALLRRMLGYSWPILVSGVAGILNQTADKILFPYIYTAADVHTQLGIYGAASKIAMIMAMITQAFRYAYEPFVFGNAHEKDSKEMYAKAMRYFIIFTLTAFLMVMAWIDVLKYIIAPDYWEGLKVVPIVMAAEIMMGVLVNLSFWYKLIDKTMWGALFAGVGCLVLVAVNVLLVPRIGYMACAWGGFAGYGVAMVMSYLVGRHYNPIHYPLRDIAMYVVLAAVLFAIGMMVNFDNIWLATACRTVLLALFIAVIFKREHLAPMLARLPGVGRFFS